MSNSIALLGRQPALGRAELESIYGADALRILGDNAVLLAKDPSEIEFPRLGGTIKLAKHLTTLETTNWSTVVEHITSHLPMHLQYIPEGKIRFGLNVYGLKVSVKDINRAGLAIKKVIKQADRSVRVVPNTAHELNSAQTLHNQLTGPTGLELVVLRDKNKTYLGQVVAVQDIDAYSARDQARPKRDAKVGMLPPKLAQIIINLAQPQVSGSLLDPFCGTGVLLQEALLMGYDTYGTDIEDRMIDYSNDNLTWLESKYPEHLAGHTYLLEIGDATAFEWQPFDTIACETYLGKPLAYLPRPDQLKEIMDEANSIHFKFLQNVAQQTPTGFRMCIAVPAWKTASGFQHLKTLDSLEKLGYTRLQFVHTANKELIYHRENQIVARELVILQRK